MKPIKLLARLQDQQNNVAFRDLERLVFALGFELVRQDKTSHRIYAHPKVPDAQLNLQNIKGEAKPYQIKQLLRLIDAYNLRIEA